MKVSRIISGVLIIEAIGFSLPLVRPVAARVWFVYALAREDTPARLRSPVGAVGKPGLTNSWAAGRSGGRRHEGIDIFAAKGTPVVSTTRGIVTRVGTNKLGGQFVGVLGPALEWHYYAHLDRFGNVHKGDIVQPGEVLGYVGNTGNARGTAPHLHYGIYREGAKNPFPRLVAN